MSVERHLILQEVVLRPSGEWSPRCKGWVIARVAEGAGYLMQNGHSVAGNQARELNVGDGLVAAFNANVLVRASQLGELKLQFFTVLPQYLNGLLTPVESRRLETIAATSDAGGILMFKSSEPLGQRFSRIVQQPHTEELASRCALLQLWAGAVNTVVSAPTPIASNRLRERFRELLGQMPEAELSEHSLGELAEQLHCSGRHFSRLFREEFGVALRTRQVELRLQRARQLLADPDAKVISVAYESGYRHLGLFNAMFKKRFGVTPGEWRRQNAVKNPSATARGIPSRLTSGVGIFLMLAGLIFSAVARAQSNEATNVPAGDVALRGTLLKKMAELNHAEKIHVVPVTTNSGPRFRVDRYVVNGNSVLLPGEIGGIFTNVPAAFGTNVTIDAILAATGDLQAAYRDRGYMTIVVGLPKQKLTNDEVKVQVVESRLVAINVVGEQWHHWYSSNNVMSALPGLHTNMLLNAKVFQRELDAANMSRDRQIYPVVGPGPDPGTSVLDLKVNDRFPLHSRLEMNNESTPGTPNLRTSFNAQYNNLWNLEHQVGVQYSFSPEQFKEGNDFNSFPLDAPAVANYSAFYRLPLGGYSPVLDEVNASPGKFGYNEATHSFNLPASTGRPEFTGYFSRSSDDTGVQLGPLTYVANTAQQTITSQTAGQNFTLNVDGGGKFSIPLPQVAALSSSLSFGLDYKYYKLVSYNSNNFEQIFTYTNPGAGPTSIVTKVSSPQPRRKFTLEYLPLNIGWGGSVPDKWGATYFNANSSFNPTTAFSEDVDFAANSYSPKAKAGYVIIQPSADRLQTIYKEWTVKLHADGQWANVPLISNEQYAMGGLAGVRGYQDGEAYGDTGWRLSIEPQTPDLNIGMFGNDGGEEPCALRGSVFMDYGQLYLLDPQPGMKWRQEFWGAGLGFTATIGNHLDMRVAVAFPLISDTQTYVGDMHCYFAIGAQF
jgi:hemolysin activation/secretion protein/AraC-like DNA-binding protein